MSQTRKILTGSALLAAGQLVGYACSFVRNVILARVLSKADFGTAAALSLTLTAFEIAGKLSIGQQVVQSKRGDDEEFMATAHLCQFLMGCVSASLIASFGAPMAELLGVPHAAWAFIFLSVLGLLNGLHHLDVMRSMRSLGFSKRVLVDTLPEVLLTAMAVPLVFGLGDYRAIVALLLAKTTMVLVLSHLVADRPYRWRWNTRYIREILLFGAPLLANSFLMFGYQQGDQLLIGAGYSVEALAPYALAFSLTMVPGYMFQYVLNTVMLPLLSQVQDHAVHYERRYVLCTELSIVCGVTLACLLVINGEWFVGVIFGRHYAGTGTIVAWLAVTNMIRITRSVTSQAAMARGDTVNNVYANFFRVSSICLSAWVVAGGFPISWVAACGVVGELLALGASWVRLRKKCGVNIGRGLRPLSIGAVFVVGAGILGEAIRTSGILLPTLASLALTGVALSAMYRLFGELRRYLNTTFLPSIVSPKI